MPVRDSVFETLKSELQTVTKANGYNFDLKVDRTIKTIDELDSSKLPAVFVVDNGAEIPDLADTNPAAIKHDLEIELLCYFRAEANLHTEFGKFMADMMKILYKPPSFTSADNFRLLRIDTVLTAPPDKIAIFTVGLTYWFDKASP